ncbi:MAG: hypothetical protein E3I25_01900 [Dehalococcoidia bacterium]|nr:MAG: hypothetical protein E3I25_01900 [Dehalococcoidia bacterium]
MDSIFMGYIVIAIGIFLGFIGIAVAIFFGLRAFRTDIKEKIIAIQETVGNVWDVVKRSPIFGATGTVERNLKNLGKIKITAEPHLAHY